MGAVLATLGIAGVIGYCVFYDVFDNFVKGIPGKALRVPVLIADELLAPPTAAPSRESEVFTALCWILKHKNKPNPAYLAPYCDALFNSSLVSKHSAGASPQFKYTILHFAFLFFLL